MRFWLLLTAANVACFVPLYVLNAHAAPNPFAFLSVVDKTSRTWPLQLLYARFHSTDPFRIHFDFTFFVLLAAAANVVGTVPRLIATLLLALGFIEIQYTAVMHSIFKRPPSLASDISLLRSGLSLAQRQAYWMVPLAIGVVVLVVQVAAMTTSALFASGPSVRWPLFVVAAALLPPCLFHWARYYVGYISRTVYSPLLHFTLNLRASARVKALYSRDAAYYEGHNLYRDVRLARAPNIVIACIESYGSIVYRDARVGSGIAGLLDARQSEIERRGYRIASTFSEAPLFTGGSWLSYASFAYGAAIDDVQLYDGLFTRPNHFGAYESLFHILRRNGYDNVLLCPLGGVDAHAVDWESVDRCFQCQRKLMFNDLAYDGPRVNYLGAIRRYSPLDQFSLNYGYERAREAGGPFSLFFCTLNSHYPWHTAAEVMDEWRNLNVQEAQLRRKVKIPLVERYNAAIHYQLDYLLRFTAERSGDSPLIVLFGDHQPPIVTQEQMGKQTPVHVLSRDHALIDVFLAHGFADTLNLTGLEPRAIRHEGFLSLLMRALQAAYGVQRDLELPYREGGAPLFRNAGETIA